MIRRLAPLAAALFLLPAMPAADAAKATTLYFANPGDSDWTPVLQTSPDSAFHENTSSIAVNGEGLKEDDTYASGKKLSFKVDTSRKVTGTVYAMCQQVIGANTDTQRNAGYVDLSVSFKLDNTKIGSINVAGPIPPTMTVSQAFSFAIPASLKGKTVKRVAATVSWKTTVGVCSISYSEPGASTIVVPVR